MPKTAYSPEWMSLVEAGARLSCDKRTVAARITRGELKVRMIRSGRIVRVHRGDFDEALNELVETSSA